MKNDIIFETEQSGMDSDREDSIGYERNLRSQMSNNNEMKGDGIHQRRGLNNNSKGNGNVQKRRLKNGQSVS